jgi:hypothetical protein
MTTTTHASLIDESFVYTDEVHAHYEQEGYHIFDTFLTSEGVNFCKTNIERMIGELHPDTLPEEMICPHQRGERWVWDLATEPKILDMIERQIGPDILLWAIHILAKRPRTGIDVPWHQDAPYWNVKGNLPGSIWIAVDDVDESNGTMSIIPDWHTKGTLPRKETGSDNVFTEEIDPSALPDNVDGIKVTYRLKAGQMATHHTMLPHASTPNTSERWRQIITARYVAADAELGEKTYFCPVTREPFQREFFLVRGKDVNGHGLRSSPFED